MERQYEAGANLPPVRGLPPARRVDVPGRQGGGLRPGAHPGEGHADQAEDHQGYVAKCLLHQLNIL